MNPSYPDLFAVGVDSHVICCNSHIYAFPKNARSLTRTRPCDLGYTLRVFRNEDRAGAVLQVLQELEAAEVNVGRLNVGRQEVRAYSAFNYGWPLRLFSSLFAGAYLLHAVISNLKAGK